MIDIAFGVFGLATLIGIAFLFSENKRKIHWQQVGIGIGLQLVFAIFVLMTPWGASFFNWIATFFVKVISFTFEGAKFVFGALADQGMFARAFPDVMQKQGAGFIFAFQVLPTIIFFSSLMSVLYHLGIMQKIVQGMAWVMAKAMKVSGEKIAVLTAKEWFFAAIIAIFGIVIAQYTFTTAINLAGPGIASPLGETSPILASIFAKVFLHEKVTSRLFLAITLTIAGVAVLMM